SSLELDSSIAAETVDLKKILEQLKEDYSLFTCERGISLSSGYSGNMTMKGDYEKLFRAFSNLLDNAVKYSDDSGVIRITAIRTDETIEIKVFNTGAGIPPESLDKVFEQFYRVEESRSSKYGGSGLGLAIVKRIAELHKGEVKIESAYGESVTVTVILPAV
ncbi:MAG: HAMP domain-containing histidine kinase, partial [Geovibrio sp.]|nr:HAMP domain-containing histidine kinase [Geovibrio sp.]